MMTKYMINGGAGFLGSHLCERLLKENNKVVCLDVFSSGSSRNIHQLLSSRNFTFIKWYITERLQELEVDSFFNLASPASPADYPRNPIKTTMTNVVGAMHLLELASKPQIPILQASTSEVYVGPEVHPQIETYFGNVNPKEYSVRQLAELIIELTGSSSNIVFRPLPQDDPKRNHLS